MWSAIKRIAYSIVTALKPKASSPVEKPVDIVDKGWKPEWAEHLKRLFFNNLSVFDSASDILNIRNDWRQLSEEQKTTAMVEFFKSLIYFECKYDPLDYSVDVGTEGQPDTYSVGLLQLSVVDQKNLGLPFGYDFEDLQDPIKNLNLGMAIMVNQIKKRKKIMIPKGETGNPGVYWATLNPGNRYDKSGPIVASVKKLVFDVEDLDHMKIAKGELGQSEVNGSRHNPRIIEYHQETDYKAKTDEISWCSSFVSWVLVKAKKKSLRTAWARSYMSYGIALTEPEYGCIMVFERNAPGGDSHVAFWSGEQTSTHYIVLGGNQGNSVCYKSYPKKDLLAMRRVVA